MPILTFSYPSGFTWDPADSRGCPDIRLIIDLDDGIRLCEEAMERDRERLKAEGNENVREKLDRYSHLLSLLSSSNQQSLDVEITEKSDIFLLLALVRTLIFSRRFISITCPECKRTLTSSPNQTLIGTLDPGYYGGRRLVCLRRHILYMYVDEWRD